MTDKMDSPTNLLWLDLEMTGLEPADNVILEVAAVVTDFNFNVLGSYKARVKHDRKTLEALFAANPFYSETFPQNRDDFLATLDDAKDSDDIEDELIDFVKKYFGDEPAIIAGNSIHNDRYFIKYWWQRFDKVLHYRMLDVSSWKLVMETKFGLKFEKKETHQAEVDINESIEELKYYLEWFKTHNDF